MPLELAKGIKLLPPTLLPVRSTFNALLIG